MKVLLSICARGGSKGIKNKALVRLNNKPLIKYTLELVKKLKFVDNIVISTDSLTIKNYCEKEGFKIWFLRSNKLSNDYVGKIPVIIDAVKKSQIYYKKNYDTIIDLDITCPLILKQDVYAAYKKFRTKQFTNIISISESNRSPYFNIVEIINGTLKLTKNKRKYLRRQDVPKTYNVVAAIYIWEKSFLLRRKTLFSNKTGYILLPQHRSIDIDTNFDLKIVKSIIKKTNV